MLYALLVIFGVVVATWLCGSSMLSIYWAFKPGKRPSQSTGKGTYVVFVGALLGFALFFLGAFYSALFFIPESWGSLDEDGDLYPTRYSVATVLGVVASFYTLFMLWRVERLVDENQAWRDAEAVKQYRKAAEQNHAQAQYFLGACYYSGKGVTKDYVESYKWFLLAAAEGDEAAVKNTTNLEKIMTRTQIAEGKRLARGFKRRGATGE